MNTVLDGNTIENTEKEQHNAMINERYRKLLNAVEDQLSTPVVEEKLVGYTTYNAQTIDVQATPVTEQTPAVTEYTPSALASALFTVEGLARMESAQTKAQVVTPVAPKAVVKAAPAAIAQYSLTPLAKLAMAVFTLVVVAMLVLIGINSQTMRQKTIRLQNLEEKKQELMERNEELQRYIQELQTEESIMERAAEAGLLN